MADETRWLVVGLGNPGSRYQATRHNVGFFVVDRLAEKADDLDFRPTSRFSGAVASGHLGKAQVLLLKPDTFMNLSGKSVAPLANFYRIPAERIIVIHDDVDLPLGRLRLKAGGGDGGHNGVASVIQELGSTEFIRIRFGVGRPPYGDTADYVLKPFLAEEQEAVADGVARAAQAVRVILGQGLAVAMNRFNQKERKKAAEETESQRKDEEKGVDPKKD